MTEQTESDVIVSIAMPVYNQADYIEHTVRSVLEQQTDFAYELVIGDDCSTDGTRDILCRLQSEAPDRIRLLLREENLGGIGAANFADILRHCRGRYICILEGDDFWNSPHKLQQQVEYMLAHPECSLCYHPVDFLYEDGRIEKQDITPPDRRILTMQDVVHRFHINTCSLMMRNEVEDYPADFERISLDRTIHILAASTGEIHRFSDEYMVTHRRHAGVTNPYSPHYALFHEHVIVAYEWINTFTGGRYRNTIYRRQRYYYYRLFRISLNAGAYRRAGGCLWHTLRLLPFQLRYDLRRQYSKSASRLRKATPVLYNGLRRLKRVVVNPEKHG